MGATSAYMVGVFWLSHQEDLSHFLSEVGVLFVLCLLFVFRCFCFVFHLFFLSNFADCATWSFVGVSKETLAKTIELAINVCYNNNKQQTNNKQQPITQTTMQQQPKTTM
jgi:hypothetical protein